MKCFVLVMQFRNETFFSGNDLLSKKAILGYKIDLQKVITIAAFYSMFYIFLYFASNYDLVILLWNVHSYICTTMYYIFQMQFI